MVGDFMMVGREQLLMFHPTKHEKTNRQSKKDTFILTDLYSTFPKTFYKGINEPEVAAVGRGSIHDSQF